jgi:hypothetical protein
MKPQVKISARGGQLTLEAENVTGGFCKTMLEQVTTSIGGSVSDETPKEELYQQATHHEQQRLQEGGQ